MSINNDIRVRHSRSGRFFVVSLMLAALALSISFAVSLLPVTVLAGY